MLLLKATHTNETQKNEFCFISISTDSLKLLAMENAFVVAKYDETDLSLSACGLWHACMPTAKYD